MSRPADPKKPDGPTYRDHLEEAARLGSEVAIEKLAEEPECPEEMQYLLDWSAEVIGRSGVGLDGLAPLGYNTIEAWARLLDHQLTRLEVEALIALDHAMRNGPAKKKESKDPQPIVPKRGWPQRRKDPELIKEE